MSSLRNAVQRRPYRERAQPKARERLGLLEKHKDYVLRAKDYNTKQARIKSLREKAAARNPEEFYFGMVKARTKGGVHVLAAEGSTPIPARQARTLKAQDAVYLGAKRTSEAAKLGRLRASLHRLGEAESGAQHTLFVADEAEAHAFDAAAHFDTAPELAGRRYNRVRTATLATEFQIPRAAREAAAADTSGRALDKWLSGVGRARKASYAELDQRVARHARISEQAASLELQRALMTTKGGGVKKRRAEAAAPGGGSAQKKAVFKWKPERKR